MRIIGGPHATVSVLVAVFALPLYAVFPTVVGLNGDLERYGVAGLSLLCGDGGGVWGNYHFEPLFVAILWFFAAVWDFLFSSGTGDNCLNPGLNIFWLPIFISTIFILLQTYIVRHLRGSAIYFHMFFCLDAALLMLPFNLLRQFIAVVIVVALVSLLIRARISPRAFIAALVVPALVHWSAWLFFLLGLGAMVVTMTPSLLVIAVRLSKRTIVAWATVVCVALLGVYFGHALYGLFAEKLVARFDISLSVAALLSPTMFFIAVFTYAISQNLKHEFARTFIVCASILYFMIAMSGDALILERLRAFLLAMMYFVFLYIRGNRSLAPGWEVFNMLFLLFALSTFFWNAIVARPFDGRPAFTQLLE